MSKREITEIHGPAETQHNAGAFSGLSAGLRAALPEILNDSAAVELRILAIKALLAEDHDAGVCICAVLTHHSKEEGMREASLRFLSTIDRTFAFERAQKIVRAPSGRLHTGNLDYQDLALRILFEIAPEDAERLAREKLKEDFVPCSLRTFCGQLAGGCYRPYTERKAPGCVPAELKAVYREALSVFRGRPAQDEAYARLRQSSPVLAALFASGED